jgi:hypothetical protein
MRRVPTPSDAAPASDHALLKPHICPPALTLPSSTSLTLWLMSASFRSLSRQDIRLSVAARTASMELSRAEPAAEPLLLAATSAGASTGPLEGAGEARGCCWLAASGGACIAKPSLLPARECGSRDASNLSKVITLACLRSCTTVRWMLCDGHAASVGQQSGTGWTSNSSVCTCSLCIRLTSRCGLW